MQGAEPAGDKSLYPQVQVLILTMHESEELLTEAILAGVRGFLFKSDTRKHLISAIEALLDGQPYFTMELVKGVSLRSWMVDAIRTGRETLKLAPAALDNLAWYANFMISLNEPAEALHLHHEQSICDQWRCWMDDRADDRNPAVPMKQAIAHVALVVRDYDEAIRFFRFSLTKRNPGESEMKRRHGGAQFECTH